MPVIHGEANEAARALNGALPGWYVEPRGDGAIAHRLDPRQHPNFYEQLEVHVDRRGDGWQVELAEIRTEMGMPERVDSMHADDLGDAARAAATLARRWSASASIGEREFDFTGGAF